MPRNGPTDTSKIAGENVRLLRTKRGLSTRDLADACGFPRSQINRLERAECAMTVDQLVTFAGVLRVKPAKLLLDA